MGLPLGFLGRILTVLIVIVVGIVVPTTTAARSEIGQQLAGLSANAVDATGPNFDAAIKRARSFLKVDRIVIRIPPLGDVVEVLDEMQIPGIASVDFL
jgi:hypothetical protein